MAALYELDPVYLCKSKLFGLVMIYLVCIFIAGGNRVSSTHNATDKVSESFKLFVINTARSWPFYFSRLFGISVSVLVFTR